MADRECRSNYSRAPSEVWISVWMKLGGSASAIALGMFCLHLLKGDVRLCMLGPFRTVNALDAQAHAADRACLHGDVDWPKPKERMADILRSDGLRVTVGRHAITVDDCSHFRFQEYGGDLGDPCIEADADSVERMIRDATLVSQALARAGVAHCFEVYSRGDLAHTIMHPVERCHDTDGGWRRSSS
jgi:hypothetical protein